MDRAFEQVHPIAIHSLVGQAQTGVVLDVEILGAHRLRPGKRDLEQTAVQHGCSQPAIGELPCQFLQLQLR